MHLLDLARKVKEGCVAEGMLGMTFNTIGVRYARRHLAPWPKYSCDISDGMTMGTEGMRYSLPSRDLIADSIETVRLSCPVFAFAYILQGGNGASYNRLLLFL